MVVQKPLGSAAGADILVQIERLRKPSSTLRPLAAPTSGLREFRPSEAHQMLSAGAMLETRDCPSIARQLLLTLKRIGSNRSVFAAVRAVGLDAELTDADPKGSKQSRTPTILGRSLMDTPSGPFTLKGLLLI